jgi:hypothetical protein
MRAVSAWLVAVSVIATFGAGCASHDGSDGDGTQNEFHDDSNGNPVPDDCASRIDAQITSGEIPNADRDYFVGMCEASR